MTYKPLLLMLCIAVQSIANAQLSAHQDTKIGEEHRANMPRLSLLVDDGVNTLLWSTSREINSRYFNVQRSDDGTNFKSISRRDGAGSSEFTSNYSYEDVENGIAPLPYYRIELVDMNGRHYMSNVVQVPLAEQLMTKE
jgi:hypothetical protein